MRERWTLPPTQAVDEAALLAQSLNQTLDGLAASAGGVYLFPHKESTLALAMLGGWPKEFFKPWERISLSATNPIADALRTTEPVWVPDSKEWSRRYPRTAVAMPYEFAAAAVPVFDDTTDYGVLFALWPGARSDQLSPRDRDHLLKCADRLAQRLKTAPEPVRPGPAPLILDRPGPAPDSAAALTARLPEGILALDPQGRLTVINPAAAELLGEPAERLMGAQLWRTLPWLNDPVYEDRYRAAVITHQPTSFTALRPPKQLLSFSLYPDSTGITMRVCAARTVPDSPTDPLHNAPAPNRTPPSGAIYHVVQLATTLTEAVGVQDVTDLIADQIMPAFDGVALALLTLEEGRLRVAGSHGYPPHSIRTLDGASPAASLPQSRELLRGVPGFFQSAKELEQAFPSPAPVLRGTMSAWAFLPLIASDRTIGVCVLAFDQPHVFSSEERTVLNSLSSLIAQVLERARLYDSAHELAHGLQSGLLPGPFPHTPGLSAAARYLPGTKGMEIGGDFYDLIPLGPDNIAAVIGDVQGHNVTAAALMGQARTAVRAYAATSEGDPGQVLGRVNRLLAELDTELFASCLYLHLDLREREVRIARAGHPQPLLRHPDGHTEILDVPGGVLLGIDPHAQYPHLRIPLPVDSTLALYTDGLVEKPGIDLDDALTALTRRLERFGNQSLDGLADILVRPTRMAEHRADDIALLLLRPTTCADPALAREGKGG